jgi:hypothetical protein
MGTGPRDGHVNSEGFDEDAGRGDRRPGQSVTPHFSELNEPASECSGPAVLLCFRGLPEPPVAGADVNWPRSP